MANLLRLDASRRHSERAVLLVLEKLRIERAALLLLLSDSTVGAEPRPRDRGGAS